MKLCKALSGFRFFAAVLMLAAITCVTGCMTVKVEDNQNALIMIHQNKPVTVRDLRTNIDGALP
jgi:hypothetical protein